MDPTQALSDIRDHIKEFRDSREEPPADVIGDLFTKVEGLDDWMSKGGFPPEQWRPHNGRPRREEDGDVVLDDVVHGRRAAYNKGCRCVPCTAANRLKRSLTPTEMKEHSNGVDY